MAPNLNNGNSESIGLVLMLQDKVFGSMYVSGKILGFGRGRWAVSQKHTLIQVFFLSVRGSLHNRPFYSCVHRYMAFE